MKYFKNFKEKIPINNNFLQITINILPNVFFIFNSTNPSIILIKMRKI